MTAEEIKQELPQHLSASAMQSAFRPLFRNPAHDEFCKWAFEVLGEAEYTKIYNEWRREFK